MSISKLARITQPSRELYGRNPHYVLAHGLCYAWLGRPLPFPLKTDPSALTCFCLFGLVMGRSNQREMDDPSLIREGTK
jgi:hypothetical protein